jgi:aspartyl-tRNA(Asn)/glutamyl-tRNA(Gln) amidotransferase subunit A
VSAAGEDLTPQGAPRAERGPTAGTDLAFASVAALSRRLRAGELAPEDLVEACLARIAALDGRLGTLVHVPAERARAAARAAASDLAAGRHRGPLHGVPFALADVVDSRGVPTALGVAALAARVPERDATVAARLAEAGAVLVGKAATSPPAAWLAAGAGTAGGGRAPAPRRSPDVGTRSPWDPERDAGGPSAGGAAAVAAGLVPFAIAVAGVEADTASAACGITCLRPSYGVLSRSGAMVGSFTLGALTAVARSAEDCGVVLDVLAGADPRDPSSVGAPQGIGRLAAALPHGLRVGLLADPAPEAPDAWLAVQEALRGAGAIVTPAALPDLPWLALAEVLSAAEGTVLREDVLGGAAGLTAPAAAASAADYVRAARLRFEGQRALGRLLARHDLLLAPAPAHAAGGAPAADPLAAAIALGGLAAVTFPIGLSDGGAAAGEPPRRGARPVAARLVAPPLEEARLLGAAAVFQAATSHHLHRPPLEPAAPPVAAVTRR